MLRALAFVSAFTLTAGAALAQPPDPSQGGYGPPPSAQSYPQPGQGSYPPSDQGYPQGGGAGYGQGGYGQGAPGQGGYGQGGYGQDGPGQGGYGQGGGGGRWSHDPQMRALRQQMHAACATDISTYCAGAGPSGQGPDGQGQGGRGALHQCMMANQARFSPPCQQAIAGMTAYAHQMRGQGGPDGAPGYAPPTGGYAPPTGGYGQPQGSGYPMPQDAPPPR